MSGWFIRHDIPKCKRCWRSICLSALLAIALAGPSSSFEPSDAISLLAVAMDCPKAPRDATSEDERARGEKWMVSSEPHFLGSESKFSIFFLREEVETGGVANWTRRLIYSVWSADYRDLARPYIENEVRLVLPCKDSDNCFAVNTFWRLFNPCFEDETCDKYDVGAMRKRESKVYVRFCDYQAASDAATAIAALIELPRE